ncbi:hypothetical protein F8388_022619 [Cannabis sativa]|uniref:RNase H type-1 domain-containing protein n=1 Tax=Cannabis sativa TaxID=3483 RepID=A0A7J6G1N0_CANSA|nr:hypothetical protein F8388_022619 [Cannabis sativa]
MTVSPQTRQKHNDTTNQKTILENDALFKGNRVSIEHALKKLASRYEETTLTYCAEKEDLINVRSDVRRTSTLNYNTSIIFLVDASWKEGNAGLAVILFDPGAHSWTWSAKSCKADSAVEAEVLAIFWALQLSKDKGHESVTVLSDAQVVANALQARRCPPVWEVRSLAMATLNLCEACEYRHSWGSNGFQELASLPKTLTKVPRKLQIDEVSWFPPPQNFIKINTDGAAKGRSNEASCGGVFRDCNGTILGAFSSFLGNKTSLEAELYGVIKAINIACANHWHCVWLEVDSILTLSMIANNKTDVPITIREEWLKTLQQIQTMNLIYSHIYREGNQVADLLANHGFFSRDEFSWFSEAPNFIIKEALRDINGPVRYRVKA